MQASVSSLSSKHQRGYLSAYSCCRYFPALIFNFSGVKFASRPPWSLEPARRTRADFFISWRRQHTRARYTQTIHNCERERKKEVPDFPSSRTLPLTSRGACCSFCRLPSCSVYHDEKWPLRCGSLDATSSCGRK